MAARIREPFIQIPPFTKTRFSVRFLYHPTLLIPMCNPYGHDVLYAVLTVLVIHPRRSTSMLREVH